MRCSAASCDSATLAAVCSTSTVAVLDASTLAHRLRPLSLHTGAVTDAAFSPSAPSTLVSASADGTLRLWDCRTGECGGVVNARPTAGSELGVSCCSIGLGGDLLAAGVGSSVLFWDLRVPARHLGAYTSSHGEGVTQVQFHPEVPRLLVSGGDDGLLCAFDTSAGTEDDALATVVNTGNAVRRIGFFGPKHAFVYAVSVFEGVGAWAIESSECVLRIDDARMRERLAATVRGLWPACARPLVAAALAGTIRRRRLCTSTYEIILPAFARGWFRALRVVAPRRVASRMSSTCTTTRRAGR